MCSARIFCENSLRRKLEEAEGETSADSMKSCTHIHIHSHTFRVSRFRKEQTSFSLAVLRASNTTDASSSDDLLCFRGDLMRDCYDPVSQTKL